MIMIEVRNNDDVDREPGDLGNAISHLKWQEHYFDCTCSKNPYEETRKSATTSDKSLIEQNCLRRVNECILKNTWSCFSWFTSRCFEGLCSCN